MVLDWFSNKELSLEELIARKKYGKAIEIMRAQFKQGSRDPRMRLQLADVLILAGKGKEAIPILIGLADEHARDGFAAKSIALLKKIEKIEPGRADVEQKLAAQIHQERSRTAPAAPASRHELGIEEVTSEPEFVAAPPPSPVEEPVEEPLVEPLVEIQPGPGTEELTPEDLALSPMSEDAFGRELVEMAQAAEALVPDATAEGAVPDQPAPAMASPLFSDFSEEELVAVMHGLRLLTFEPGDIIITEGEPGTSLFVLTTGVVKAFVRNPAGRHVQVREMAEGAFFGEISVLTGGPRTATVTAGSACELLELDKAVLDEIAATHPHVKNVLQEFHDKRSGSRDEEIVRKMAFGRS